MTSGVKMVTANIQRGVLRAAGALRHRLQLVVLLGVLASLVVLVPRNIAEDSPTEDEWAHLVRGISYWQNRDMRVHVQHPPLANALEGLSVAFDEGNPQTSSMKTWRDGYSPGYEYITKNYGRARAQLQRARYVAMLFLPALVVYVFFFSRRFFGVTTALAAVMLTAWNPSLIAQTRYVTTDMPAAVFSMIAVGEFIRYLVSRSKLSLVLMPLALAGAALAKHNGVLWIPVLFGIGVVVAWLGRGRFAGLSRTRRMLTFAGHGLLAAVIFLGAINAVYKFDQSNLTVRQILDHPEPKHWVTSGYKGSMLERRSPLPKLPGWLPIPLPYPYLFGLFAVQEQNRGGYPTFFMGESSRNGHVAYFPVLLAIKTPPAVLFLLGAGLIWVATRRRASLPTIVLSVAAGTLLVVLMRSNLNMGVRHAMPIVPLVSVLAARSFDRVWWSVKESGWRAEVRQAGLWGLGLVLSSVLVSAVAGGPDYLGYFNLLAGGRKGGHEISIVGDDWGQDRLRFVKYVQAHQIRPLYYHTETPTRKLEVQHWGLEFKDLGCRTKPKRGSWIGIHAQYVRRYEGTNCASWLRGLNPIVTINEHVHLYWYPPEERKEQRRRKERDEREPRRDNESAPESTERGSPAEPE